MVRRLALLTLCLVLWPCSRAAALSSFVDQAGVWHFTNVPADPRYREMKGFKGVVSGLRPSRYEPHIRAAARRYALDHRLVKAMVQVESGFDRYAVSAKGAMGLMQLMPQTAGALQVAAPFDPQENLFGGSRYLRRMLDRFGGNLKLALAAYNAGPEQVRRSNGMPAFAETRKYVDRVLREYRRLQRLEPIQATARSMGSTAR